MRLDADTPETWHRQMDELGNGRTNPVFFRDFDGPQTEFPEKSDLILLFSLTVTQSMRLDADTSETWHRQMDELDNGRTNPVCFRDFDGPQTEFPEKSDLILLFSLTVT